MSLVPDAEPFATVRGEAYTNLPADLYIPPDALRVMLASFTGPLDLLLYLIRRQNLDILDIPIAEIARQYTQYIDLMQELKLELAGEYLVMAATLAHIKSRLLLPRPATENPEEDPRALLVRRLQEYQRYQQAAVDLDALPRVERDIHVASGAAPVLTVTRPLPSVSRDELYTALRRALNEARLVLHHHIHRESISVRARMSEILTRLSASHYTEYGTLLAQEEGRLGAVVTFVALLELVKETLIQLVQNEPYAPLHARALHPTES